MKIKSLLAIIGSALILTSLAACDDQKSYSELLSEENFYVNNFLADQYVIQEVPEDSVFEVGPNAPYYRIDEDGNMYMQVLDPGNPENKVSDNEQIYFRYTRYELSSYPNWRDEYLQTGVLPTSEGNGNNTVLNPCWFRYNNYQLQSSYTWGYGIQKPLEFFGYDCKVNIVIKSANGPTSEQADVVPYLWTLTYEPRQ